MGSQTIVLTGFMGTGKTTVGKRVAEISGRVFIDTDTLIMEQTGRDIPTLFAEEGETGFRQLEREIAQSLSGRDNLIIATGGRLILDPTNAHLLSQNTLTVCLTATPEEILARVANEADSRPLLRGDNPAGRIRHLLTEREPSYRQFIQIQTSGHTPTEVAQEIVDLAELNTHTLTVKHPAGQYPVMVGAGLLPNIRQLANITGRMAVVTDTNVGPLYARQCGAESVIVVPAGEQYKTLHTIHTLYTQLLDAQFDRHSTLVSLGGGVVGDMTGFVAATFLRGINFVQCPTSLLAMVDASVGGKTGVDMPQGKNLIGAFKQPTAVIADLLTLQTLPPAEFTSGLAEVVKHSLISGDRRVESGDWGSDNTLHPTRYTLQTLVTQAIAVKQTVVQSDPFEQGRRAVLNLGHTFGHAIEQVSGYAVRHGEGVAMGLVAATHLSARMGLCSPNLQEQVEQVLVNLGLPIRIPAGYTPHTILQAMYSDKKRASNQHRLILIRDIGDVFVSSEANEQDILDTLNSLRLVQP